MHYCESTAVYWLLLTSLVVLHSNTGSQALDVHLRGPARCSITAARHVFGSFFKLRRQTCINLDDIDHHSPTYRLNNSGKKRQLGIRVGANFGPELDFLANSNSNSYCMELSGIAIIGIGVELP